MDFIFYRLSLYKSHKKAPVPKLMGTEAVVPRFHSDFSLIPPNTSGSPDNGGKFRTKILKRDIHTIGSPCVLTGAFHQPTCGGCFQLSHTLSGTIESDYFSCSSQFLNYIAYFLYQNRGYFIGLSIV